MFVFSHIQRFVGLRASISRRGCPLVGKAYTESKNMPDSRKNQPSLHLRLMEMFATGQARSHVNEYT